MNMNMKKSNDNDNDNYCNIKNKNTLVIIMAGGLGKRMNSDIPKVLHKLSDIPMLIHVIETAILLRPYKICLVVGKYYEMIYKSIKEYLPSDLINKYITFIHQECPLGTGNAILSCNNYISNLNISVNKILILSGDVPLINFITLNKLLQNFMYAKVLTAYIDDPTGYGRVLIDNNSIIKIIEEKDCNAMEKNIKLINSGIYAFNRNVLCENIVKLDNNNSQKEYYLTQIIEKINDDPNNNIQFEIVDNINEIIGVNTTEQLKQLENI